MERGHDDTQVFNYLNEIDPEVKQQLVKTEAYQRFLFERARLEKMAAGEFERNGKLSTPEVVAQCEVVDAFGAKVLDEIKSIQFMLHEPSFEDFQAMRSKLK